MTRFDGFQSPELNDVLKMGNVKLTKVANGPGYVATHQFLKDTATGITEADAAQALDRLVDVEIHAGCPNTQDVLAKLAITRS